MVNGKQFTICRKVPVYNNWDAPAYEKPLFTLAGRFKVFKHTETKTDFFGETSFSYVIKGSNSEEKVFVNLRLEHCYNLITHVQWHRHTRWECQLSLLLVLAFLQKLKNGTFDFAKNAIPEYK